MEADSGDLEFTAMQQVYAALKSLDSEAQARVLDYVSRRLALVTVPRESPPISTPPPQSPDQGTVAAARRESTLDGDEDIDGISPIAIKWMRRSQLSGRSLSKLFSLGIEEIDLVAKSVPGKSKAERVKSIALLLGIAGYLSTGAARVSDEKLREACGHYDAYDGTNFSKHLKAISAEVAGTKENGYVLTSRGLTEATELVKALISPS